MIQKLSKVVALLCISTIALSATPNRYQIEIIVFKRTDYTTNPLDSWQSAHQPISTNHRHLLDDSPTPNSSFVKLRPNLFTLAKEEQLLTESPTIKPIMHLAWQATANELNTSPPIMLTGGSEFNSLSEFYGLISIQKEKYFTVKSHLILTDPKMLSYHSVQQNRTQENELVYFDSPVVGMLMKITVLPGI